MSNNRKLLLIRGKHDAFTEIASQAAEVVKTHAKEQNWDVIDKLGNNANKNDVVNAFENNTIDFVIHYGHGKNDSLLGQKNNRKQRIFGTPKPNLEKLREVHTSTLSCYSASELGPKAAPNSGTNAYLGYTTAVAFPASLVFIGHFIEAYNKPNMELLSGSTFQSAKQEGKTLLLQKYYYIGANYPPSEDRFFAQAALLLAHNGLTVLGEVSATAT